MGITVYGNKDNDNFYRLLFEDVHRHLNPDSPPQWSLFSFYNQVEKVASEAGWELVQQWDQNVAHNFTEYSEVVEAFVKMEAGENKKGLKWVEERVRATFAGKKALIFPAQLAIFRKK